MGSRRSAPPDAPAAPPPTAHAPSPRPPDTHFITYCSAHWAVPPARARPGAGRRGQDRRAAPRPGSRQRVVRMAGRPATTKLLSKGGRTQARVSGRRGRPGAACTWAPRRATSAHRGRALRPLNPAQTPALPGPNVRSDVPWTGWAAGWRRGCELSEWLAPGRAAQHPPAPARRNGLAGRLRLGLGVGRQPGRGGRVLPGRACCVRSSAGGGVRRQLGCVEGIKGVVATLGRTGADVFDLARPDMRRPARPQAATASHAPAPTLAALPAPTPPRPRRRLANPGRQPVCIPAHAQRGGGREAATSSGVQAAAGPRRPGCVRQR